MFEWIRKRRSSGSWEARPERDVPRRASQRDFGKYRTLYEYLEKRYAGTVVLTFRQLEDLLGFSLPDVARTDQSWWTTADSSSAEVRCSDAWILASRTALPNLGAQTVSFERIA
jgi:hypothetical protein